MSESLDIDRLQDLNDSEWARAEATYSARLVSYISRRIADPEAREDVLQETFLGAVRGIGRFDRAFKFEQYLFGICHNRTIDQQRRGTRGRGLGQKAAEDELDLFDALPIAAPGPSSIMRRNDLTERGNDLLAEILSAWVAETWAAQAFDRLCVMEAILLMGRRNKDLAGSFGLRDEGLVAGIKFRALKRLGVLAKERGGGEELTDALANLAASGTSNLDIADTWRTRQVSCPARHWLARWQTGALDEGAAMFIQTHTEDHGCVPCKEALGALDQAPRDMKGLLGRLRQSQRDVLQSTRIERKDPPSGG